MRRYDLVDPGADPVCLGPYHRFQRLSGNDGTTGYNSRGLQTDFALFLGYAQFVDYLLRFPMPDGSDYKASNPYSYLYNGYPLRSELHRLYILFPIASGQMHLKTRDSDKNPGLYPDPDNLQKGCCCQRMGQKAIRHNKRIWLHGGASLHRIAQ